MKKYQIKGLVFIIIVLALAFSFSGCNRKTGCEIKKAEGFRIENNNLYIEVDCNTKHIPLYEYIEVSPNATYTVTKDISGVEIIPSTVVSLELEENIYYINVVSGNGTHKKQYVVNINIRHTPSDLIIEKATCVENGSMYKECTTCDKILEQGVIYSEGHNASDWIIDKEATCTERGLKHIQCTVCHKILRQEEIQIKINIEHNFMNGACPKCGKSYHCDGTYIYFGFYPQTIKEESVVITNRINSLGYYLGSDGEYYAKVVATSNYSNYIFSNETEIVKGNTYYFKVEPIKWRILEDKNGDYQLLSEYILDCKQWDGSLNNYKNSDIRLWLNNTFYNQAFSKDLKEIIQITEVDNSVASTGYSTNPSACENTNDKIYLLSYLDATNTKYGFNSTASRQSRATDYAMALGIYVNDNNSHWFLRSPSDNYAGCVRYGSYDGNIYINYVHKSDYGVRPALTIKK